MNIFNISLLAVANKLTTFIERVQRVDQDQEEADKKQIKKVCDENVIIYTLNFSKSTMK